MTWMDEPPHLRARFEHDAPVCPPSPEVLAWEAKQARGRRRRQIVGLIGGVLFCAAFYFAVLYVFYRALG